MNGWKKKLLAAGIFTVAMTLGACAKPTSDKKETSDESVKEVNDTSSEKIDSMEKYDSPVTITTAVGLSDEAQSLLGVDSKAMTDNSWFNGYLNDLGIKVEVAWSVPSAQYNEKLNAQISADDLPDVFSVDMQQLKTLSDNGMIMDLTEVFDTYMSDFTKQMMEEDGWVALEQSKVDGKVMALPNVSGNHDSVPLMWIRRDWLKKVNMEAPTTLSELEAVIDAFVTKDPDGDGVDDTYGVALANDLFDNGMCDLTGIMEMMGAHKGWVEKNGKAEKGLIQPEMNKTLELVSSWFAKGYLDKEFIAKDSSKVAEDIIAGKVGITFGQHWTAFWPFSDAKKLNDDAEWYPYPIPAEGQELPKVMVGGSASQFFVVNANCKNPEAVVKMYNYFYQKDCAISPDYDSTYHISSALQMQHPEQSFIWSVLKTFYPQQNLFISRGVKKYLDGDESQLENAWVADNAKQVKDYIDDPVKNKEYYASYIWSGPEGAFTAVDSYEKNGQRLQDLYVLGNTDGMTMYEVALEQLTLETFTKIITGEKPISEFDSYVSQWKNLGGEEITQEVNERLGR
ncbi:MAG: extracellular solute-binding protein [Acetatifactor sp.]|nr:extracellular solute-binding protein [Acetatifactor sp.]